MYFMSDPQALHVTRNVIPGKLGVDLHLHRVHIPLVYIVLIKSYILGDTVYCYFSRTLTALSLHVTGRLWELIKHNPAPLIINCDQITALMISAMCDVGTGSCKCFTHEADCVCVCVCQRWVVWTPGTSCRLACHWNAANKTHMPHWCVVSLPSSLGRSRANMASGHWTTSATVPPPGRTSKVSNYTTCRLLLLLLVVLVVSYC